MDGQEQQPQIRVARSPSANRTKSSNQRNASRSRKDSNNTDPMSETTMIKSTPPTSPLVLATVGDRWSGKSALYVTHITKHFPEHHVTAAEVEDCEPVFFTFPGEDGGMGRRVALDLFEVSGDMYDFNEIRHFNYSRSDVILICFSVVRPASFQNVLKRWAPEVRQYCRKGTPVLLVGTQTDMRSNDQITDRLAERGEEVITYEQGRQAAKKLKAVKYIECSAKTQSGLNDLFDEVERLAQWLDKRAHRDMCVIS